MKLIDLREALTADQVEKIAVKIEKDIMSDMTADSMSGEMVQLIRGSRFYKSDLSKEDQAKVEHWVITNSGRDDPSYYKQFPERKNLKL